MNEHDRERALTSACAAAVGASFLLAGVFLFLDPLRQAEQDDHLFWMTLARQPLYSQLRFLVYALGGIAAFGAIPGIAALAGAAGDATVRWMTRLGYLAFAVTAVDNFRLFHLLPRLGRRYAEGDPAVQAQIRTLRHAVLLDPGTWVKFGALGAFVLVVSLGARRAARTPAGHAALGVSVGAMGALAVAAFAFGWHRLIVLAAGLGGIVLVPSWFFWTAALLRRRG